MQGGPGKEDACREGPRKERVCREGLGRRVCAGRA